MGVVGNFQSSTFANDAFPLVPLSPRYPNSVFVLCDSEKNGQAPVATCFAISNNLLLSCQHFMKDTRTRHYTIALAVTKDSNLLNFPHGYRKVKVVNYNKEMDYAILKLAESEESNLFPIPISVQLLESDVDLKIFHCPLEQFQDTDPSACGAFTKWTKSGVQLNHHVLCDVSLFKGSSGSPYILRSGHVVAIHIENVSRSERVPELLLQDNSELESSIEILSNTVNSHSEVHSSMAYGLLISKCPALLEVLRTEGVL